MAFPDRLLTDGETVLWHRRAHWRAVAGPLTVLPVAAAAAGIGIGLIEQYADPRYWAAAMGAVVVVFALIVVVWSLLPWLRWRGTQVVLTDRRLLLRSGVVDRRGSQIALWEIVDVTARRTAGDRLLGGGTVMIRRVTGPAVVLAPAARAAVLAEEITAALPPLPPIGVGMDSHTPRW